MNLSKHTPGPWELVDSYIDPQSAWTVRQLNGGKMGLYIGSVDKSIPASKANARLISAAPELLEALLELREWAVSEYQLRQMPNGCVLESILTQCDAAISKAKGEL